MQTFISSLNKLEVLQALQLAHEDLNQCLFKAQCSVFTGNSSVETFFKLNLRLNGGLSQAEISISSGKYLNEKATLLRLTNSQGDTLTFGFHNNKICFSGKSKKQEFDLTPNGNNEAYENVLESLYLGDHTLFISPELAMAALQIITPVLDKDLVIHKYEPGWCPN
jgi:glucose-6-phosphate 1-dehydrogenase